MPSYFVFAATGRLSADAKQRIAQDITRIHNQATGAQSFFAQVIFNDVPQGNHFVGGSPLRSEQIFVHGHIRAGRTAERKRELLEGIVDAISKTTDVAKRYVWAYISELPPAQMVEYGHVLPEPGTEQDWLSSLPAEDRDYMQSI
ncbi:tautomerase family protein [Caballeronia sp. LjRoot29]|uniref:tautomerase family protein n=1 Tax=Caballeronia sp. LjRoot29 TaxID=3342315 RepID=UPI003ECE82AF